MLEVLHRDGRGRVATWQPQDGLEAASPGLIIPDVPQVQVPEWARLIVTQRPTGRTGLVEIVSQGTWFHPATSPAEGGTGLVVAAPQPVPTDQVQVLAVGSELAVFHDAGGWASDPSRLMPAWIEARTQATSGRLLWAPMLGTPQDYALWAYLGADLFDASPLLLHAVRGEAVTTDGVVPAAGMEAVHGGTWETPELMAWNLEQARQELARVAHAIEEGTLRALVERRVHGRPGTVETLRRFDREHDFLAAHATRHRTAPLACMTWDSIWSPEVRAFRRRFRDLYRPPEGADILVLLPCSQTKPYRLSPSHRRFARALDDSGVRHRIHEVMVTSPLGLVPREVENVSPAQQYDVPVTGMWNRDEEAVIRSQLEALLAHGTYRHIVAHVDDGTWRFLRDLLPDAVHTAAAKPTGHEALQRLRATLHDLAAGGDARSAGRRRKLADLRSLLSLQFSPDAAEALCDGAHARGKAPYVKLLGPDGQRGQTTPERGHLSLARDGARIVADAGIHRVHIADFTPEKTSSLFAVGVEGADADVRVGDEVVVVHEGDLRGWGVARMAAEEMTHARRGVAVQLRRSS